MGTQALPSEMAAVVDVIDPDAYTTGAKTGAWVEAKDFHSFLAIVQAGTLGTSATLNAKIQQATDGSGTGAKDISGAAITELTQASPDDSDKQALINLRTEDMDVDGGFTHIQLSITVGTATSDAGAALLGFHPRHAPASDNDASSVAEIVTP